MNIKQIIIIIAGFILVICTFIFPYWHQPGDPSAWAAFYPVTSPPWSGKGVVNLGYTLIQALIISGFTLYKAITIKHHGKGNAISELKWIISIDRLIIFAGCLFILLSLLIPPWKCFYGNNSFAYSTKYAFVWRFQEYCHIDIGVLIIQTMAILIILGVLLFAFRIKSKINNKW